MLTIDDFSDLDHYGFGNSPESSSDNSCITDITSDEDFLQQLSSGLDIPLLLNPGEDEMSLLNSFFDKSPEEILSELTIPPDITDFEDFSPLNSILVKTESDSSSSKSSSPPPSDVKPESCFTYTQQIVPLIKDEIKVEPKSPNSPNSGGGARIVPQKIPMKRPIHPKATPYPHKNNVVLISNNGCGGGAQSPPTKVVVLENIVPNNPIPTTTINVNSITTTTNSVPSVVINGSNMLALNNIDPRILKKQQRKIKNRESACLSRKKKKDYLTSLENQVKELESENQKLKIQNFQLKERLSKFEKSFTLNTGSKNIKGSLVLCIFLLVLGVNMNFLRGPFINQQNKVFEDNIPQIHGHGRNLLWSDDNDNTTDTFQFLTMCPAAVNQTESARLVSELERWIGKPRKVDESSTSSKLPIKETKPKIIRKRKLNKRKIFAQSLESSLTTVDNGRSSNNNNNEIKLFSASDSRYRDFFEAINRQDDTFYVVSLSNHNMLLPALYHNKTRRPKMSLIMPSMVPTINESSSNLTFIPLMQIDCEVLDTRLIKVQYGLIPQHLRMFESNKTEKNEVKKDMGPRNKAESNYTNKQPPVYKPYFINDDSEFYNYVS